MMKQSQNQQRFLLVSGGELWILLGPAVMLGMDLLCQISMALVTASHLMTNHPYFSSPIYLEVMLSFRMQKAQR
jgi:hypothetical protein